MPNDGIVDIGAGDAPDWQSGASAGPPTPSSVDQSAFFCCTLAPFAAFLNRIKSSSEPSRACQTAYLDSGKGGDGRYARCWLSPSANIRALRSQQGARAPSRKSILRARGGEGKGVWACGSRGGTEELAICQPARRFGRNTQHPSGGTPRLLHSGGLACGPKKGLASCLPSASEAPGPSTFTPTQASPFSTCPSACAIGALPN